MISEQTEIYEKIFPSPKCSYSKEEGNLLSYLPDMKILDIPIKNYFIPALFVPATKESEFPNSTKKICLFYHGNGEDIGHNGFLLSDIQERIKIDFLAIEYPGYGTYKSPTSIQRIKEDALEVHDYLTKKLGYPENNILIMGRSMGSGPAIYLASRRRIGAVIIISGFSSLTKFINEIFTNFTNFKFESRDEDFDNLFEVENVKDPICFIHGEKDKLIIPEHTREMMRKLEGRGQVSAFYPFLMTHNSFDVKKDLCVHIKMFFKSIDLIIA